MILKKPEDMNHLFAEAFNSGDVESVLALYEHEATPIPQPGQVVMDIKAIREALLRFIALKGKGKMTVENKYCIQAGDVALLRAKWHLRDIGPDGNFIELEGNITEIVRRQPNGNWLYIIDHPFGAN
jgi:ketosteroid isomerase-like protein